MTPAPWPRLMGVFAAVGLLACGGTPAGPPPPAPPPPPPPAPTVDISTTAASFQELIDRLIRTEPLHIALQDGLAYQVARAVSFNGLAAGQAAGDPGDSCTWDVATDYWTCVQVTVPTPGFSVNIEWAPYLMDPTTLQPVMPLQPLGFPLTVPREDGTTGSIIVSTATNDPGVFNTTDWNQFSNGLTFTHEWNRPQVGWGYSGSWARQGSDTLNIVADGAMTDGSPTNIDFTLARTGSTSGNMRSIHVEVRIADVLQPVIDIESMTAPDGSVESGTVRADGQDIANLSGTFANPVPGLTAGSGLPPAQLATLTGFMRDLTAFEEAAIFRIVFGECIRRQDVAGCSALEP